MDSDDSDATQDEIDASADLEQEAEDENIEDDVENNSQDDDDQETQPATSAATFESREEHWRPSIRPEALSASVYDVIPTIAAPHSTSINAVTATPDLHWVFSGGSDGYIRKFNWVETANGKSMLTVAQRHPFVDSVTKAGVLASYWENSDGSSRKPFDESAGISAVYSLAVQREALWLLSGLENGGINLQSVRHDEGKRISCLRGHTSAISVMNLAPDEKSFLSGSWDKTVLDWDLNTGKAIRSFDGSAVQISALGVRPTSNVPVPKFFEDTQEAPQLSPANDAEKPQTNGILSNGGSLEVGTDGQDTDLLNGTAGSPTDSLFGGNDADSLFGDNENLGASSVNFDDDDNDFSRAIASGLQEQGQANQDTSAAEDTLMADAGPSMDVPAHSQIPLKTDSLHAVSQDTLLQDSQIKQSEGISTTSFNSDGMLSSEGRVPETQPPDVASTSDSTFLAASIDGSIRIWDKRQKAPVARMTPHNVPPWCMNACWSPDGNFVYAGRRNGTVDVYSLHAGLQKPFRNLKLPSNSGAVSAVQSMPNGRHLICASFDILRLYDLHEQKIFKNSTVPFLIVPGHRTSVVSQLYIDPTCRYLLSSAGNRGWEGSHNEVLLGYEIVPT